MKTASRMILARQLIYCAKMVLDAEQFNNADNSASTKEYNDDEIREYLKKFSITEVIEALVPEREKYSGWAYGRLRQIILNEDDELKKYLNFFGVKDVQGSGYEIHHTQKGKHIIQGGHCKLYYRILELGINDIEIQKEIKEIVIIPTWFHKRIENNKTTHSISLTDRKSYYIELKNCLMKLQDRRTDEQKKEKKEYQIPIKSLRFNSSNIHSAIKSIEKLALTVTDENKDKMIKKLQDCYDYLRECIGKLIENITL